MLRKKPISLVLLLSLEAVPETVGEASVLVGAVALLPEVALSCF